MNLLLCVRVFIKLSQTSLRSTGLFSMIKEAYGAITLKINSFINRIQIHKIILKSNKKEK